MSATAQQIREVARAICRAVSGAGCVMDEKPTRCTEKNCRIVAVARDAIARARAEGPGIAVNIPFSRVPSCAHDPGVADGYICPHGCNK